MPGVPPKLRQCLIRRLPLISTIVASIVFVAVLLGPALAGQRTFGAAEILERQDPWYNTSGLVEIHNRCVSDTVDAVLPGIATLQNRWASGDPFPAWDPLPGSGTELTATQKEGFYSPLILPALFAPLASVGVWIKVLELVVAIGGMWLWCRRLKTTAPAALLGGFLFATSGFMVMWTGWPQTRTAAVIPLLFWGAERIIQDRTVRSAWPLAVGVFSLVAGGFMAVVAHALYALTAYVVVRLWAEWRRRPRDKRASETSRTALIGIGAAIVGIGAVAFQVTSYFARFGSVDLAYRAGGWQATLHPAQGVTAYFGTGFAGCSTEVGPFGTIHPVEGNVFVGSAALLLVAIALTGLRGLKYQSGVRIFLIAGSLVTAGAIFIGGPISWALHFLPLMGNNPMPRIHGILGFFLAALAALGYDALIRRREHQRPKRSWIGLAAATAVQVAATGGLIWAMVHYAYTGAVTIPTIVGLVSFVVAATTWLLVLLGRKKNLQGILIGIIPLFVVAESGVFAGTFWTTTSDLEPFRDTATTDYLQAVAGDERVATIDLAFLGGRTASPYGLRTLTAHAFPQPEWADLVEEVDPHAFLTPTFHRLTSVETITDPLLDRLAVAYVVAPLDHIPLGDTQPVEDGEALPADWDGTSLSFVLPPGGLRGIVLHLSSPVPHDALESFITVSATDGITSAESRIRFKETDTTVVALPLAGEDFAGSDGIVVTLSHDYPGRLSLAVSQDGSSVDAVWSNDGMVLDQVEDAQVYFRPTALERVRWATVLGRYTDLDDYTTLARRASPDTALVPPEVALVGEVSGKPASIAVESFTGDDLRQRVVADGPGLLVVADAWNPEWHAYVDGESAELHRVEWALMGVFVPEGDHVVSIRYEPAGWGVVLWFSLLCLTVIAAVAYWDGWVSLMARRRRGTEGGR